MRTKSNDLTQRKWRKSEAAEKAILAHVHKGGAVVRRDMGMLRREQRG
jgi:hypothetical protein